MAVQNGLTGAVKNSLFIFLLNLCWISYFPIYNRLWDVYICFIFF